MVIFKNANYLQFLSETKGKRIIFFGAGQMCHDFIKCHAEKLYLFENVDYILDNSPSKEGQEICFPNKTLKVVHITRLLEENVELSNYVVLLLLGENYLLQIVEQLDKFTQFDDVPCYYGRTAFNWGLENYPPLPVNAVLPKSSGKYRIPKIIHYIWFGRNPMSYIILNCIESWRRYCPDYELRLWNEDNYDLTQTPLYVRQAYESKKYAFVSDYVRLDVVYKYGGFYLDCDVELFRNLDDFLPYKSVFAFMAYNQIASGLGFGSVANNPIIENLIERFSKLPFVSQNGELYTMDCPRYETDYFRINSYPINNELYMKDDILFVPSSFLCSMDLVDCGEGRKLHLLYMLTNNSYGLHHCFSSWFNAELKGLFEGKKAELRNINNRLLFDWKRMRGTIE